MSDAEILKLLADARDELEQVRVRFPRGHADRARRLIAQAHGAMLDRELKSLRSAS